MSDPLTREILRAELGPFGRAMTSFHRTQEAQTKEIGRVVDGQRDITAEQRVTNDRLTALEAAVKPVAAAQAEEHAEAAAWRQSIRERPFAWLAVVVVCVVVLMLVARGDAALLLPVVTRLAGGTECPTVATGAP